MVNDTKTDISSSKLHLVTVAMDGGLLSSPVHPIGMSAHPGSLKTAFSITAHNEKGFISALSKCQSGINAHRDTWSSSPCESFLRGWHFR